MSQVLTLNESSIWISNQIKNSTDGWAAGKIGTSELNALLWFLNFRQKNKTPYKQFIIKEMTQNAGFWKCTNETFDEALDKWSNEILISLETLDAIVSWNPIIINEEMTLINNKAPQAKKIVLRGLEPYYSPNNQYTLHMTKGPIAVISPFAKSITKQWQIKSKIFPPDGPAGIMWLSEQKLIPINAAYGPHMTPLNLNLSWSKDILDKGFIEAINFLVKQVLESGAKYAFVGIGALSIPLVCRLKKHGIIAIHTGGGTQIMFGIKGLRWKSHSIISTFFNEYWISPSEDEIPSSASKVEGGCYW
jgi:hypothetical protein